MSFNYPLMLDVSSRRIVIIGGGAVAARKAKRLLDAGATRVDVIAPDFSPDLPPALNCIREPYRAEHLDGASLVFAATDDPAVNAQVVRDAHERSALVCRADSDDADAGDFATPATFSKGPVTVAVSAGSPALSATIRDGLAWRFDPRWSAMAQAMKALRPQIVSSRISSVARAEMFRTLASEDALYVLAKDGENALKCWLIERHPELA